MRAASDDSLVRAFQAWFAEIQGAAALSGIEATFKATAEMDKAVASFAKEGRFVATIEVWANGEADFTVMALPVPNSGVSFEHGDGLSGQTLTRFANRVFEQLVSLAA